jgi:hypothetical protein
MSSRDLKLKIINAGYKAVEELIKIAEEKIIVNNDDDNDPSGEVAADKLKNAAQAKKLAIFDAFEILKRIEDEKEALEYESKGVSKLDSKTGFAERRGK